MTLPPFTHPLAAPPRANRPLTTRPSVMRANPKRAALLLSLALASTAFAVLAPAGFALASLALASPALAAQAETPMTAAEFEAYATGKTLSYAQGARIWGSEQYLPDRQVIWAFDQDDCQYGIWFEDAGNICFVYENDPAPQCWRFYNDTTGLRAEFVDDPANTALSEVNQTPTPLQCNGPDVGA